MNVNKQEAKHTCNGARFGEYMLRLRSNLMRILVAERHFYGLKNILIFHFRFLHIAELEMGVSGFESARWLLLLFHMISSGLGRDRSIMDKFRRG